MREKTDAMSVSMSSTSWQGCTYDNVFGLRIMIFTTSSKITSFPIDIYGLHLPPSSASNFAQESKTCIFLQSGTLTYLREITVSDASSYFHSVPRINADNFWSSKW